MSTAIKAHVRILTQYNLKKIIHVLRSKVTVDHRLSRATACPSIAGPGDPTPRSSPGRGLCPCPTTATTRNLCKQS